MARLEEARTGQWSQHDLQRLLLAAERLGLDPLGGEIYAVPSGPDTAGPALLVLGVDGWCRVINAHPAYLGVEFREGPNRESVAHGIPGAGQAVADDCGLPAWVECTLHRKDRRVPTTVREYLAEARTDSPAWLSHPRRMLRHKALVQCARVAFGLAGLYDPDEALRVQEALCAAAPAGASLGRVRASHPRPRGGPVGTEELKAALCRS
jgi:phage recombination protein Bet